MINERHMKSNHGLEKSLNNYRLKYIHHLNYWKNTRTKTSWIIFENPLFNQYGKVNFYFSRIDRSFSFLLN